MPRSSGTSRVGGAGRLRFTVPLVTELLPLLAPLACGGGGTDPCAGANCGGCPDDLYCYDCSCY